MTTLAGQPQAPNTSPANGIAKTLKELVERPDTRGGRAFDLAIQFLVLVSIVSFSIETLPNLTPRAMRVLGYIEVATVAIFTVEYLLRVWAADRKAGYIFSFFGIVDFLAILPFYVTRAVDLRAIRALRLMRLLRVLKLGRYTTALDRLRRAFRDIRDELVIYAAATVLLIFLASVGIYYCENPAQPAEFASVFHAMWWSVVTLTTVGYGDVYPVTIGGRILTGMLLLIGVGIVAVPSGLFAAALTKNK